MNYLTKVADSLRKAYAESRGVSPHELLHFTLLKHSEQDQWLETAHVYLRIAASVGLSTVQSGPDLAQRHVSHCG